MLLAALTAKVEEFLAETAVDREIGLAHIGENTCRAMLGRNLELSRNVVADELAEEGVVGVCHEVVKADSRADEYLFDSGNSLDRLDQIVIFLVIDLEVGAGLGREAFAVRANAAFELFIAGGSAEIRRGTADVVYVTLEIGHFNDLARLGENAFLRATANASSLMECESAEIAGTEAAAVVRDRKSNLRDSGHAAVRVIDGMYFSCVGERVNAVELLTLKRRHRGILYQQLVAVKLGDGSAANGVLLAVLRAESVGVGTTALLQAFPIKLRRNGVVHLGLVRGAKIAGAAHVADLFDGNALVEQLGNAEKDVFAHSVGENVGAAVDEDRAAHTVFPIIVVGKSAKRGFEAAKNDRHVAVGLSDQVRVNDGRAVGAQAGLSAGRIIVVSSAVASDRIVRNHRVNVARRDEKAESGLAKALDVVKGLPVRLCQNCDAVTRRLKHTRYYGNAKRGMIDVGIPRNIYKIGSVPSARLHIGARNGKKFSSEHFLSPEL